jgi:GntR family transcriptional repressor for pyruvate dehydrogenase complex
MILRRGKDGGTPMDNEAPSMVSLKEIRREPTLSEKVAEALTSYIFDKGMRPGDKLPSERELGEHFKVSRTVIREAVRSLVGKGLLQSQSGARLTVSEIASEAVGDLLDLVVRGRAGGDQKATQQALWKLHEVRSTIEVQIAGLAAQRASADEVEGLRRVASRLDAAKNNEERVAADEAFHRAIAKATHNEFYELILDSLVGPLQQLRRATLKLKTGAPDASAAHGRILNRIAAGDVEGARAAMAVHIAESGQALEKLTHEHLKDIDRSN